jgi:hypothetical protein
MQAKCGTQELTGLVLAHRYVLVTGHAQESIGL